jgi:uncharacterized protein
MTLFIDTSALVKRYVRESGRELVLSEMDNDPVWCASAITRTETQLVLHRIAMSRSEQAQLWSRFRDDWDAIASIPVDDRLLVRATEIGAQFGVTTTDAIHLAAADRLPRPVRFLTFDSHQIPAALALDLDVVSPDAAEPM